MVRLIYMANITDLVPGGELTEKQLRFMQEYLIDCNGAAAAIRAGYSEQSARFAARDCLQNPTISRALKAKREQLADETHITAGTIINNLMETYSRAMQQEPVLEFDPEEKRMMPSGEWQFDGKTATRCMELIAKMLGFIDTKTTGDGGVSGLNIMFISHLTQLEAKKQGITIDQLKKQVSQNVSLETEGAINAGA